MDPYYELVDGIASLLSEATGDSRSDLLKLIRTSSGAKYGDLSFPLMRYTKQLDVDSHDLFSALKNKITSNEGLSKYISNTSLVKGYLNITLNEEELSREYFGILCRSSVKVPETKERKTIVIEHTSANPVHPLHMGHARNSSLGDTLSRLLKARGHSVNTRFYVDDVGRQSAVAALGGMLIGVSIRELAKKYGVKPDWILGYIYSMTHLLLDISDLTRKIGEAGSDEEEKDLIRRRDDLLIDLSRVIDNAPKGLGDELLEAFEKLEEESDPFEKLKYIMRSYESKSDEEIVRLIRESVEASLEGFRETLGLMDVYFDDWDWESDIVWSGLVWIIIDEAKRSPHATMYKGALALDLSETVSSEDVARHIELPKTIEIPPLILVRSDGTTLYTTRDIAYTIYKYEKTGADNVINVIGADQRLPQIQIRLALYTLGYEREALNTLHYSYEIVRLPGERMSGRKGRLLGLDTVLKETFEKALNEVAKRNPGMSEAEKEDIAWKIAVGAVRYSMISINAMRPITYSVDRATSFEGSSGPYIQYTYARANGILRKLRGINWENINYATAGGPLVRDLLLTAIRLPYFAAKAADDLKPELLANYLIELSDKFNSWYQRDSVLQEEDYGAKMYKAALTLLVKEMLGLGMGLTGIPLTPRM
ncbi:MAG: arginine--tRNA ligase [Desulfurococcales archaeon]|nr:arginine--tRNA ligase [Desulfurococcales archaeon]